MRSQARCVEGAVAHSVGVRITIDNVEPGPTATDMNPDTGAFADEARSHVARRRCAQPGAIADFVAYLASPGAGFITGAALAIDGGYAA